MTESERDNAFNRETALCGGLKVLKKIERRLSAERFKSQETDSDYVKFVRAYSGLLSVLNQIQKDVEIADLERRIDELEKANESS